MIIDIVRSNFKIIIFGFIFTLFSSVGQSYFIGLFNPNIRQELNISHGGFGTLYAIATLCSSLALIWIGKKIDEIKLVNFCHILSITQKYILEFNISLILHGYNEKVM